MSTRTSIPKRAGNEFLPTRQSLLSRLRNYDDSKSWEDFFNSYWKLIYGVAIKSGLTETEAQEVVQETIIAVSKKIPDFKYDPAIGSFKAWLLNQTRWRIQDQFRKRRRDYRAASPEPEDSDKTKFIETVPDPGVPDLQLLWDEEWRAHLMHTATQRIKSKVSPRHFQVFDLLVNKRWPVEKIQQTLGISANQIYLAKHRISILLREEIQKLEN